jgi:hypothetical protein
MYDGGRHFLPVEMTTTGAKEGAHRQASMAVAR